MILGAIATLGRDSIDYRYLSRRLVSLTAPGVAAVAFGATFGVWTLHQHNAAPPKFNSPATVAIAQKLPANPYGDIIDPGTFERPAPVSTARNSGSPAPRVDAARRNAQFGELVPFPPADTPPLPPTGSPRSNTQLAELVPVPPQRPREFATAVEEPAPPARPDRVGTKPPAPPAPTAADDRNFLQKLLSFAHPSGSPGVPAPSDPRRVAMVSTQGGAASESGVSSYAPGGMASDPRGTGALGVLKSATASPTGRYDQFTAVYDLSAHVVYLPDGRRLEAHSGLGSRLDDPRHVDERMRGATPPHMYELTAREGSFHGVKALRLNPVGQGGVYGRAGLLAHPFMLGPNGDSNGCVSIREYDAFLQAYQRGQVKRLAVVASVH